MISLEKETKLDCMVGNTPLLEIKFDFRGKKQKIFAKAEHLNMTGSIKDRMALHILKESYKSNRLKSNDLIAEATSGNTGISLAAIGRAFKHQVFIYMPDWMSKERIALIKSFGAKIVLVSKEEGGFLGSIEKCDKLSETHPNVFLSHQFSNDANCGAHFRSTGPEVWHQLGKISLMPDAFVAGVGTGGTIMGVGKYLNQRNPKVKLFPVQPAESPVLSAGRKVGTHRIQGISDEFIPAIVNLSKLDEVFSVFDGDAILMAQKLASELGLAVGISSGANFVGALMAKEKLGLDSNVVTVFADSNKKYLSTDLFQDEPSKENYLSSDVKLLSYKSHGRLENTSYC